MERVPAGPDPNGHSEVKSYTPHQKSHELHHKPLKMYLAETFEITSEQSGGEFKSSPG